MGEILYYDCFAGISGDMNLSALIDIGVNEQYLVDELGKLKLDGYHIKISSDMRRGISGTKVEVVLENDEAHEHSHSDNTSHKHGDHQHQHHEHRSFKEIKKLIKTSNLSDFVKNKSVEIFLKLAEAEGKVHNKPIEDVHFHEVGAIDSIVDIVGAAICIDYLKPSKIIASRIELGSGMVRCAHGMFPVPAPATLDVLKGIPVKTGTVPFEATTPTGASILAVMVDEFVDRHNFKVQKIGYGIGHKDSEVPNVLRVMLCKDEQQAFLTESAIVIECNIDDMNPEIYDSVFENLFENGAQDVFLTNIAMKKSRPAVTLSVLCKPSLLNDIVQILLSSTSTLGVRTYEVQKYFLEREIVEITTSLGKVKVKKAWMGDIVKYKPEYDDCSKIAKEKNIPILQVINQINKEIDRNM
jgi:pyridinium-3,5-bisthiocarboxylic acid mononucleotide nickel chelatase